ncbi:YbaN family protein [Pontibaca salina]|uniref:YbaN family protein n=1 Tax=Pontibaca salina TaxID=2795731 RepID=A0A934HS43_9RHOB|nr:YbaN family protein [Pontibaca salina]MBI6629535.1 YbaN family protein [Pontibaca salina]
MEPHLPETPPRRLLPRLLWTFAGWLALVLGVLGVVLPVLPTTPFVLLAAYCFGKGSPRLRAWLIGHRTFGPLILDWETHGAIPRPIKRLAVSVMALVFLASAIAGLGWIVLTVQAICLSGAAVFILTRPDAE